MKHVRRTVMLALMVGLTLGLALGATTVTDTFDTAHNYLTDGVAGTFWDGFIFNGGVDTTQNCAVTEASVANGVLKLVSTNGNWENAQDDGVLLYKTVAGDFAAEVTIVSANKVTWHDMGLMARVADDAAAGVGRDYVVLRHFISSNYNVYRSVNNNVTSNSANFNVGSAHRYLRMERAGNVFRFYTKANLTDLWQLLGSVERTDLAGLPVQVGLWQATFSANAGIVEFDDFSLELSDFAVNPTPAQGATRVPVTTALSWEAPMGYIPLGYNVYFSADPNALATLAGTYTETQIDPVAGSDLAYNTVYYWRVDTIEPNGVTPLVNPGTLWQFTTEEATPYVTVDPVSQTVARSSVIDLSVTATNATDYAWYWSADAMVGDDSLVGSGNPIQVAVDDIDKEGWYYCVASNTSGTATSGLARVMMARLVGWWPLDGTLNDAVGSTWAGAPAHAGTALDPNYAEGVAGGQGCQFLGDGRVVTMTDSVDYFNFYPQGMTVSCWAKIPQGNRWDVLLSKQKDRELGWQQGKGFYLARSDINTSAFGIRPSEIVVAQANVDTEWHLLTGVHDPVAGVVMVYVDGKLAGQKAANPALFNAPNTAPLILGAESTDGTIWPSYATIDEVKIWNYALDAYTIAQQFVDVMGGSICVEQPAFDLNDDCRFDLTDLVVMIPHWLESGLVE